ncbi:hypothetical protein ACFL4O_01450 [bacterium]
MISNKKARIYLMAFDLKEPWATHRKYQIFEDKYADLFARPEVNADRILFCHIIMEIIEKSSENIKNQLFAKYVLTKQAMLYIVRSILEEDKTGVSALRKPDLFIRDPKKRKYFKECIQNIINDIIVDINAEVDELGSDFDYRGKLIDAHWVKDLKDRVQNSFLKIVKRKRINSFQDEWNTLISKS